MSKYSLNDQQHLARAHHTKDIVKRLRTDLILGKYAPGSRLIESKVAEQMNVSRAPVRAALQVLAQEGLAINLPNGGTEVVGFTTKLLADLFDLRCTLEKRALSLFLSSTSFHYRPILEIMEQFAALAEEQANNILTAELDIQFHRSLIMLSNNHPLLIAWNSMASVMQTTVEITNMSLSSYRHFYEIHRAMADLIIRKDPGCLAEIEHHIMSSKDIIIQRMEQILLNSTLAN